MEDTNPPTWAIEEALKRAGDKSYSVEDVLNHTSYYADAILAMAALIAEYEQQPVDPVALVLADYYEGIDCPTRAAELRCGHDFWGCSVIALRTALEKHGMLK